MECRLAIAVVAALAGAAHATPRDFTPEVRTLYAVGACGEAAPVAYDASVVATHCRALATAVKSWKTNWRDKAAPFFAELLAKGYPKTVVYPFGGGDLTSALAVYPDATEYTTLSLEGMGDPRPLGELAGKRTLGAQLDKTRTPIAMNLGWAWNTTSQLSIDSSETGAGLPGILTMTLVALDANGYEPLEARYFKLERDGAITYLTQADVDAYDNEAKTRKHKADNAVQRGAFNDIEIVFRKKGEPSAPKKTFRHITADLSDAGLAADPSAIAYLERTKDIAAMTKAASYLLWKPTFGKIRDYLLAHMKVMISDDTGIPPRYAHPAGFKQETWGTYTGTFFDWAKGDVANEMVKLWSADPPRALAFRFGYYDNHRHAHVLYTHK
jgi:hypothetical protein